MIEVAHLNHSAIGIRCSRCGARFAVHRSVLCDPDRLLRQKESIAEKHRRECARIQPGKMPDTCVMVPCAGSEQLDAYWQRAMQAMNVQPMRGS